MYRERLWPAPWVWILAIAFALMLAWAVGYAMGSPWGVIVLIAGVVIAVAVVVTTVPSIEVSSDYIAAGSATLPRTVVKSVDVLEGASMVSAVREVAVPTFLLVRPWATRGGIRIALDDPADPHAQWLLTSRHPAALRDHILEKGGTPAHGTLTVQEE